MDCVLMHKDIEVCDLAIVDGILKKAGNVRSPEHMPLGTFSKGFIHKDAMREWWNGRSIPASRNGLRDVLAFLSLSTPTELITKSLGLSLSDQYWVRPNRMDVEWRDVDFFDNGFSDNVGEILFGDYAGTSEDADLSSPDNTTDGVLKNRWAMINGKRCLIKGSDYGAHQEPFNEAIASVIMDALDIPHVHYDVIWIDDEPYSVCDNMITSDTELISGHRVMLSRSRPNNQSDYEHYVNVCSDHGLGVIPDMDRMFIIDYIINNGDRHTNNFGIIRDADDLRWLNTAPIYDSGSSLGHNILTENFQLIGDRCKPFADRFPIQLRLVKDLSWFDIDMVDSCIDRIQGILDDSRGLILPVRRDAIIGLMMTRSMAVQQMKEHIAG